jgi:hypothetical protein
VSILSLLITIFGLCLFETISSVDNAIINAEVLSTMSHRARRWFLIWGLIFAVFMVRGLLPLMIVWLSVPDLSFSNSIFATFSNDPMVKSSMDSSAPFLLIGGGTFLVFLFFQWLFLEPKHFGLKGEKFLSKHGIWFYTIVSVFLCLLVWLSIRHSPVMAFGAVLGSTIFFVTNGFKQNAEHQEKRLMKTGMSDISKILYLEIIDATFSIDGVFGAFAFTLSVPLILLGNGLGALVLRQVTVSNIDRIKKYKYLKNGAMYSIFLLGIIMIIDSFGIHIPEWASPLITFLIVTYFFLKSRKEIPKIN